MTKQNRKLLNKNCARDSLTNKIISASKEVIVVDNAIDWVKKQGYIVIKPSYQQEQIEIHSIKAAIIIFSVLSSILLLGVKP